MFVQRRGFESLQFHHKIKGNIMELTDFDKRYIVGLIDEEGSIMLTRLHANEYRRPVVSVASTTLPMLEYITKVIGGTIVDKKVYAEHHKQSWTWSIKGDKAIDFLAEIYPYFLEPEKRYRAKLIVQKYKAVTSRNGKYNDERRQKKEDFERRFLSLTRIIEKERKE